MSTSWFVGVDVGGTFTDVVLADTNSEVIVDKPATQIKFPQQAPA
jgi:N-methylhydantoinase A/oxoprolinase/acetone carboxylase beta subunit